MLAVVAGCGCCLIPCIRGLIQKAIDKAFSQQMPYTVVPLTETHGTHVQTDLDDDDDDEFDV